MNSWLIFSICKCFFLFGGVGGTLSRHFLCSLLVVSLFKQLLDFFSLGGTIWPLWVLTREVWESLNPFLLFFLVLGGTINPLWVLTNSLLSSFLPTPKSNVVRSFWKYQMNTLNYFIQILLHSMILSFHKIQSLLDFFLFSSASYLSTTVASLFSYHSWCHNHTSNHSSTPTDQKSWWNFLM